jgi:hypothetical protein
MKKTGMLLILALLSGCAGNSAKAEYKKDPRGFMREVVACQSNYQTIGHTARCRQALRLNASLFNPE